MFKLLFSYFLPFGVYDFLIFAMLILNYAHKRHVNSIHASLGTKSQIEETKQELKTDLDSIRSDISTLTYKVQRLE